MIKLILIALAVFAATFVLYAVGVALFLLIVFIAKKRGNHNA